MHHTIARMSGKPEDYRVCSACGSWNWYENDCCVNCHGPLEGARTPTEKDATSLEEAFSKYNLDSMELDV